jgi:hypothetical protein
MNRTTKRPLAAGLGAVIAGAAAAVLVPTPALAAENVDSGYNVGCTIHPDQGYGSSGDPAGVSFDGVQNEVSASPVLHTITGSSLSTYVTGTGHSGEDCGVTGSYRDLLTVGAGSSGLAAGAEVPVQVTVRLDADLAAQWGSDRFQTRADYSVTTSVTSLDDCSSDGEGRWCATPLSFGASHEHYIYWSPPDFWRPHASVDAQAERSYHFTTNAGTDLADYTREVEEVLCEPFPCTASLHADPPEAEVFTGTATLVVGDRYSIAGHMNLFTQAYDSADARGAATVEELSLSITPASGFEGVQLAYASGGAGEAPDTVAPVVSGVTDLTVASTNGTDAVVGWTTTAEDDQDGPVAVTCDPSSGSTFPVGRTTVTCVADDQAGNTSEVRFVVTVTAPDPMVLLDERLAGIAVPDGIRNALRSKYDDAVARFEAGDSAGGCEALVALGNQVSAQAGKKISTADAAMLQTSIQDARPADDC